MYLNLLVTHKENLEKVKKINQKWLNNCGVPYIIVYGDPSIKDDYYIEDKYTLVVKCPDTYEYLTLKLACAYKFIATSELTKNVKGIFKIDDDVLINVKEFKNYISKPITNDYIGHMYRIQENTHCSHHQTKVSDEFLKSITFHLKECDICYGPMYYISRHALNTIVSKFSYHTFNIYSTELFEDYTFGNILKYSGISGICMKMFTEKIDEFKKNISFISFHDANHTMDLDDLNNKINEIPDFKDNIAFISFNNTNNTNTNNTIKLKDLNNKINEILI
jgi:hypothetical protein